MSSWPVSVAITQSANVSNYTLPEHVLQYSLHIPSDVNKRFVVQLIKQSSCTYNKRSTSRKRFYAHKVIRSAFQNGFALRSDIVLQKTKCKRSHQRTTVQRRWNVMFLLAANVVAKINPLTNIPFIWWPKSVCELYSCKLKYCTYARWMVVIIVMLTLMTFERWMMVG